MARRRVNTTKYEIIRTATNLFVEVGYSNTTPKLICDALDISTGNLTYYFPTKEHLLAVLTDMLCSFQNKLMTDTAAEGETDLLAICLELATMASASEDDHIAKELFLAAYSSPMCLEIIRRHDAQRAKQVFKTYRPDWTEEQYAEAETLVSGIEFATFMTTGDSAPLETRIAGALNNILGIYNVPPEVRNQKIAKVLAMDYRALGSQVLDNFRAFVEQTNEHTFEQLLSSSQ